MARNLHLTPYHFDDPEDLESKFKKVRFLLRRAPVGVM